MDMAAFVIPKSDQLNADDLIAGPRTIRVERVTGTGNADQPVAVYFEGDGGKPFKPCKSMRRVMIAAWGADAAQYVGRSMTLYRDPKVAFGGMEVGGIRISHMSHIERPLAMALTVTKAKRAPYQVQPLAVETAPVALIVLSPDMQRSARVSAGKWLDKVREALSKIPDAAGLTAWRAAMGEHIGAASEHDDAMAKAADAAITARQEELLALAEDDGFPGRVSQ